MSLYKMHDQPLDPGTTTILRWTLGAFTFLAMLFAVDVAAWLAWGKPPALAPTHVAQAWWLETVRLAKAVFALAAVFLLVAAGVWLPWLAGGAVLRLCHVTRRR